MSMKEILRQEALLQSLLAKEKDRLVETIRKAAPPEGVTNTGRKGGPVFQVVSTRAIMENPILDLAPSTWSQDVQADSVARKVRKISSIQGFLDCVEEMAKTHVCKINQEKINLNPSTVKVLESYLEEK